MDDGRPHGPDTTDTWWASKPDLALQSSAAWSLSPGSSPLFQPERKRFEKRSDFLKSFCSNHDRRQSLPVASTVMLPGCPERRVHILFIRLDRSTSAAPLPPPPTRALYSRFVDAPPRRSEANSAAFSFMTTGSRCGCRLGTFLFQARRWESILAEISIKITDLTPPTSTPFFVEHGWPMWGSGTFMGSLWGNSSHNGGGGGFGGGG